MKYFFLFILALILSGASALGSVSPGLTAQLDGGRESAVNITSQASTDSNAIEVDGIRFEVVVPNQTLSIPENRPDVHTTWRLGVRVTNNNSLPRRVSKYALTPQFRGLNGNVIFGQKGAIIHVVAIAKSDFPLLLPGDSFTVFWEGTFQWIENRLLLDLYQKSYGTSLEFGAFSPGTYHVRLTYENDYAPDLLYYDREKLQRREIRGVLKGQFSTPWVEINLVAS